MLKLFWNALKLSPLVMSFVLLTAGRSLAEADKTPISPMVPMAEVAPSAPSALSAPSAAPQQIAGKPATNDANQTGNSLQQIDQYNQAPTSNQSNPELNQIERYTQPPSAPVGQVTSVSQLTDVRPTDWAFQALQSLVERYGCIVGYPDSTYRGNRALTRYEFAAGLNACLNRVNELIAAATSDLVRKEDLATLQRLQEEFAAELATLRGRVDALEARTAELEARQFSTTTKLSGEAIFAINGFTTSGNRLAVISGRNRFAAPNQKDNVTFSDRERLSLNTSFSGKDLLRVRLQARNTASVGTAVTGTNQTRLGFEGDEGNSVGVDQFFYRFGLGDKITVQVDATNTELNERGFNTYSPFESSGRGSISRYGRFSPIYRLGNSSLIAGNNITNSGTGAGVSVHFNPQGPIGLDLGFLAPSANNPTRPGGIITGSYAAIGQINIQATKAFGLGLTYARSYDNATRRNGAIGILDATGSQLANSPFGNIPTSANNYGVETSFRFSPNLILFGWAGYTQAIAERNLASTTNNGGVVGRNNANGTTLTGPTGSKADIFYYAGGLAFPDFGKQGSLLGFLFGQTPKLANNDSVREVAFGNRRRKDNGTSYHAEGFYRFALSDNIDITPGALVIIDPENNSRNSTEYVGTIRTTFRF